MEQVKKLHRKHDLRGKIVNYVLLVLASIFVLIPFFYLVMTCFKGSPSTAMEDFSTTCSSPSRVVAVASLSSTSMAVGPTSRLP